jgi:hypothetical protein
MHVRVAVDAEGREVASRCSQQTRVLERYPVALRGWAEAAGRPLLGARISTSCPPMAEVDAPRVTFPRQDQVFALDPDGPQRQEIALGATSNARAVRFIVDGRPGPWLTAPFHWPWALTPGSHEVAVEAAGQKSRAVSFEVAAPAP